MTFSGIFSPLGTPTGFLFYVYLVKVDQQNIFILKASNWRMLGNIKYTINVCINRGTDEKASVQFGLGWPYFMTFSDKEMTEIDLKDLENNFCKQSMNFKVQEANFVKINRILACWPQSPSNEMDLCGLSLTIWWLQCFLARDPRHHMIAKSKNSNNDINQIETTNKQKLRKWNCF